MIAKYCRKINAFFYILAAIAIVHQTSRYWKRDEDPLMESHRRVLDQRQKRLEDFCRQRDFPAGEDSKND